MRKPGTNENNVQMSDVICDFCHREWTEDVPMIEGHHGSCICGKCLTVAYTELVLAEPADAHQGVKCTMCLEPRNEPEWQSPLHSEAMICRRCIRLAAGALQKQKEFGWKKPE